MRINSEFKVILIRCAVTSLYELDLNETEDPGLDISRKLVFRGS